MVPSRTNLVFAELNPEAASLFQVCRTPGTSHVTLYELSLGNSTLAFRLDTSGIQIATDQQKVECLKRNELA